MTYLTKLYFLIFLFPLASAAFDQDTLAINLAKVSGAEKAKLLNLYTEKLIALSDSRAEELALEAVTFCENLNNRKELAKAYKHLSTVYRSKSEYAKAIELLQKGFVIAEEEQEFELAGGIALNLGSSFFRSNNDGKALDSYLKSLSSYEKANSEKGKAKALSGISLIYMNEKKFKEALEIDFRVLAIFDSLKDEKEISRMYNVIANVYDEMKSYDLAIDYYQRALKRWEAAGNQSGIGSAWLSIGDVYRKQKQWDKAEEFLLKSLPLILASGNATQNEAYCYSFLAEVMEAKGKEDKALDYYLRSVKLAKKLGMLKMLSTTYHDLSDWHERKGDYKTALAYHDLHVTYYDSVYSAEKDKIINELEARFESTQKEKEIVLLKNERTITRIYWIAGVSLALFVTVIVFLIINRKRLRAKKDAILSIQQQKLLEVELNNKQLLEDQLHEKIEFNNRSLTAYTLNLIHKNEMLEDIKVQVEIMKRSPDAELPSRLQNLLKTVNYSIHLDKDWENFKFHFEQVHQGFFDKVKAAFPDLTMNDLFLCSLIRLNLETKQIATLMDISADSAKVSRSRLRKKLNLATEQNLVEFLNTF